MSPSAIQHLLSSISVHQVTGYFLVLARLGPLFVVAPLFSSAMVPARVRTIVALALTLGMAPLAMHGQRIPTTPMPVAVSILEQILVGGALAFAIAAMFAAVQVAGTVLDAVAGFSFGAQLNPLTGTQDAVLSRLYALVGTAIFIAISGYAWVLRGVARTFQLVPLGCTPHLDGVLSGSLEAFAQMFTAAIELAAPVLFAVLVTDIAFGMVSRVVPQLNVFAVGFPVKVGVAIIMVTASLPFMGGWLTTQVAGSVGVALHEIGA